MTERSLGHDEAMRNHGSSWPCGSISRHGSPWQRTTSWQKDGAWPRTEKSQAQNLLNPVRLAEAATGLGGAAGAGKEVGSGDQSGSDDAENAGENQDASASLDPGVARSRVEALLLIAKSPLSYRRLAALAELEDATQARTLVADLNALYDANGRGIRIEQIAGGSRMMTRGVVSPWLRRLGVLPEAIRLSWPMMETLAIVAYRQDVTRADVEAVRGVACGEILRQLMSVDLVRISGRSEELGRPYLYGTTKRFLQICGLASINALPAIDSRGFCEDVSGAEEATANEDSAGDPTNPFPTPEPDPNAGSPVSKESDVSIVATDALATDSVLSTFANAVTGEGFVTGVADPATPATENPAAVIEDEEDDLYERGLDDDDDEDFVDDEDDWDDDDDEDDDLDEDDDEEEDDDSDDSWEEVDDDEADEDWDDEDDDEEDDDWDEDDGAEDDDDDEEEELEV
ncbi:SMC-Scp complex subunit ScpB [Neorhodopirellula lusitana]